MNAAKTALRGLAVGSAVAAFALVAIAGGAGSARADVTHKVERGQTLESIAHHYGITIRSIVDANHVKQSDRLEPGQTLVIPGIDTGDPRAQRGARAAGDSDTTAAVGSDFETPRGPFERDVIHAQRPDEAFHIRVKDSHGKVPATSFKEFEQMMRQGYGEHVATHPPDPRLVALIGLVSNHFGGRTLEIVSGYRAYKPTQYTPMSRHNYGRALDFRIRGIPNETLRDFCRTLRNTGCGYYPNSTFVHMDVRDAKAYWIDLSHPGEAPQYVRPGTGGTSGPGGEGADEGTSDVTTESH
jgi:uncharacterized protein YcbK (DUF882 family)